MVLLAKLWERLPHDVRHGCRLLLTKPGLTIVAVLSIALGIGATTAIFSVVHAVLIDPYPYRDADRIGQTLLFDQKNERHFLLYTKAQYIELKSRVRSMEDAVAVDEQMAVMTEPGMAQQIDFEACSWNMFEFFGVPPLFGRVFRPADFPHGGPEPVAVLSYSFWQRAFQGRPDVLGKKIRINTKVYTVIGVLPVRFTWNDVDVYTPLDMRPSTRNFVQVFYRIRKGVTARQVAGEFEPIFKEFRQQDPRYFFPEGPFHVKFVNVNEGILGKFAGTLLVLFGAVTLLLLIACGNVANLLLARAASREGEMAVRAAIGASRFRLIRQLLTESVILALTGAAFGILLAYAGVKAVIALMPEYSIPHEAVIALNWPVLWFALGVSVLTGIIFGLAPAAQLSGETQAETLRGGTKGSGVSVRRRRLHDALMVAEVTLSLVLLTAAGLALSGLMALEHKQLGYDPQNVLTVLIPLGEGRYTSWASREGFFQNVLAQLRRYPEVKFASITEFGTPPYNGIESKIILDDRPPSAGLQVGWGMVSDGYFEAIHTPLLRGRMLTESDMLRANPVALVSELFVKRFYPNGKNPIGHHMQIDLLNQPIPATFFRAPLFRNDFEIVGIVGTARNRGLDHDPDPSVYVPYTLLCTPNAFALMRVMSDPQTFIKKARQAIRSVDPNQPIMLPRTLEEWLHNATAYPRFATFLFGVFGAIGMLLAAAGVFSVVSYGVAHRTREFGIRMALGARPADVLRMVFAATARTLALGLFAGLGLSLFATRLLANRMEGMGQANTALFVIAPLVLIAAALLACFVPARAATLIQPNEALRHE
jgi:predicted permease